MNCGMNMTQQEKAAEEQKTMTPCPMCGGSGMTKDTMSPEQEMQSLRAYVSNLEQELSTVKQRMDNLGR